MNKEAGKTKDELISEVNSLRHRITELEESLAKTKTDKEGAREREETRSLVFDVAPELSAVIDREWNIFDINESMAKRFGKKPEEMIGINGWNMIPRSLAESRNKHFQKVFKTGEPCRFHDNNQEFYFINIAYPVSWENGKVKRIAVHAIDITEHNSIEKLLPESNVQWQLTFDNIRDAVCVLDDEGKIQRCNKAMEKLSSNSGLKMRGQTCCEYLCGMVGRVEGCPWVAMLKSRSREQAILQIGEKWFEITVDPILDKHRKIIGAVHIASEITRRKKAEEALEKERFRLLEYIENLPLLAYNIGLDGRINDCNHRVVETLEYENKEELLDKPLIPTVYAPGSREKAKELFKKWSQTGKLKNEVIQVITKTGKVLDVLLNVDTIYDIEGKPLYSISTQLDVTNHKRMGEALKQSEERYSTILRESLDGFTIDDMEGRILEVNNAYCRMTGYTREELLGMSISDVEAAENPEETAQRINSIKEQGYARFETQHKRKDGTIIDLEVSANYIEIEGGRIFVFVRDITERKRMEKTLHDREKFFHDVSMIASDVVYERDLRTGVADFYGDIDSHLGYELGEYPRTMENWREHVHPDDLKGIDWEKIFALEPGLIHSAEYRMKKKDGTYMTWLDRIQVIVDEETGQPVKFIGAVTDITEKKKAEDKIRIAEQNFRNSLDESPLGVFVFNPDSEIIYGNQAILNIFGYDSLDELKKVPAEQRFTPQSYAEHLERIRKRALGEPTPVFYQEQIVGRDGEIRDVQIFFKEVHWDGEKRFQALFQDITEAKKIDIEYRRNSRLIEETMNSLDDALFVVGIPDRAIVACNPAAVRIFGYEKEEIIGRNTEFLHISPEKYHEFGELFMPVINDSRIFKGEFVMRRKDGSIFPSEHTVSELRDESGRRYAVVSLVRDITKRKKAEEELRLSEQKYRTLVEDTSVGIASVDLAGNVSFVNRSICDIFGYKEEDFYGKPFAKFVHPDSLEAVVQLFSNAFKDPAGKVSLEFRACNKDGKILDLGANVTHIKDEDNTVGFIAVINDITERKRAEKALEESEKEFRQLFETMPSGVAIYDAAGDGDDFIFKDFNQAGETIEKVKREDITGKPVTEVFPGVKEFGIFDVFQRVWRTGEPEFFPEAVYRDEVHPGTWRESWVYKLPSGEVVSIYNDISERKEAEEELRKSKEFSENLIISMRDGVSVLNPDGAHIDVNPALIEMTGFSRDELLGSGPPHTYWPPEEYEKIEEAFKKTLDQDFKSVELTFMRKNGERFPVIVNPSSIADEQGRAINYMATVVDITEWKRAEETLRQSEEKYRAIFEQASDSIVLIDMATRGLIDFNDIAHHNLGYTRQEFAKMRLEDINAIESAEDIDKHHQYILEKGHNTFETKHRTRSGDIKDIMVTTRAINLDNKILNLAVWQDITERKRAEETLKQSEEKYRAVFEQAIDSIALIDIDSGEILDFNDTACRNLGYSREEFSELMIKDIDPDLETDDFRRNRDEHLFRDQFEVFESKHRTRNGEVRDVRISTILIHPEGKNLAMCIWHDVTEKKRIEEALQASEEKYRTVVENTNTGILVIQDGRRVFHNSWIPKMLGYSDDEYSAIDFMSTVHPEDIAMASERIKERLLGIPAAGLVKMRVLTKSGEVKWIQTSSAKILWNNKPAVQGFMVDITEQRRAEEDLRKEKELLAVIMENSDAKIAYLDRDFNFLRVNNSFADTCGYQADDMVGKNVFDLYPHEENQEIFARVIDTGVAETYYNKLFIFPDQPERGDTYWNWTLTPVKDRHGIVKELILTLIETTEHVMLDEERQKIAKLESIGILAGGIAHDFNNLLTGIMGNISLAKRHIKPENRAFERLDEAERASVRARDLTQQLLTFARGGQPVKKLCSIPGLIRESAGFAVRGSKTRVGFSLPDDLWAAEIDEGQIGQVIHNVVINADESMPAGGTVNVSASNVVLNKQMTVPLDSGKYVRIDIRDEGIGMSPEQLSRIFEPYYTTKQKGSGLGLATAYSIVINHGGYITIESKQNKGTVVHIYLPASEKVAPKIEEKKREEIIKGKGYILVMDDEEVIRELLSKMLPLSGYDVETSGDGAEAISKYKEARDAGRPFDAVIMDLTIAGGMGGKEAVKELLEIDPGARVIVSSGYANDPIMSDYRDYGFKAVITKPYSVSRMEETLRDIL